MSDQQPYDLSQSVFLLVRDQAEESHPPSLLPHVDQGDYFGTLATVLNFVRESIGSDFLKSGNVTMTQPQAIRLLAGMRDDLVHLQNHYDLKKKE